MNEARKTAARPFTVKPLVPGLLPDYLNFFEHVAFTDNHDWEGCYCVYHLFKGTADEWEGRTSEDNRADAVRLIQEGKLRGYLAYDDEEVVGWCNVNGKPAYGIHLTRAPHNSEDERTACIVCFTVAPAFRRQGVASQLLETVIDDLRRSEVYDCLEAYPVMGREGDAANYYGPLAMYLKAGFEVVSEAESHAVVRKMLRPSL